MNSEACMASNALLVPTSSIFIMLAKWPAIFSISDICYERMISRDCRITKVTLTSSSNGRTPTIISHHESFGAEAGFFASIQINNQWQCLNIKDNMHSKWTHRLVSLRHILPISSYKSCWRRRWTLKSWAIL
jgi:hypothetical protein